MPTHLTTAPTAIPVAPPKAWFANPQLKGVTPLTVDTSGRVYGHLASWKSCHVESAGMGQRCITAPKSRTGYSRFMLGYVATAEGEDIPTGPIVAGAPHADPSWSMATALEHYSNNARAVADVRVGEDSFGIWFAGALRPTTTPEQVRALRGSPLSGDWRTFAGHLELVSALAVSSPGFVIERPRALIASAGTMTSAVAIGIVPQRPSLLEDPRALQLAMLRVEAEMVRRSAPQTPARSGAFTAGTFARVQGNHPSIASPARGGRVSPDRLAAMRAVVDELRTSDDWRELAERNATALGELRQAERERSLVASLGAPGAAVQAWAGPIGFEGVPTGDGRVIGPDALSAAAFPLPLRWAPRDVGGHDGAIVVGRIDSVSRRDGGAIWAEGLLDLGSPEGREIARQIAGGFAGGISLDLDAADSAPVELNGETATLTTSARVRAATIVAVPAFSDARIELVGSPRPSVEGAEPDAAEDDDCGCADPEPATNQN
ncbi:MAG: hypothetical protein HIU88_12730 [Acidobacteria bacterium]|nr:hypothetical protein [Acidobacteriota bacterium]